MSSRVQQEIPANSPHHLDQEEFVEFHPRTCHSYSYSNGKTWGKHHGKPCKKPGKPRVNLLSELNLPENPAAGASSEQHGGTVEMLAVLQGWTWGPRQNFGPREGQQSNGAYLDIQNVQR